jgi:hypothetical protein
MKIKGKCIHCKSAVDENGYGRMLYKNKSVCEHRVVYTLSHPKEDITKKIIHHKCHNRFCVNPKHLIAITRKQHSIEHGLSGWALIHSKKTHCKNGHKYDGFDGKQRYCKKCRTAYKAKWAREHYQQRKDHINLLKRRWRHLRKLKNNLCVA